MSPSYCRQSKLETVLTLYNTSPDMTGDLKIAKPDWESYCQKVADLIVAEQSPARVLEVRTKLYELLSHCIPPTVILKVCPCLQPSYSDHYSAYLPDDRRAGHGQS